MSYYNADVDAARNVIRRVEVVEVDDSGDFLKITVVGLADEYFELAIRGQGHGMTSVPKVGAVGYAMLSGGRPDQAFLLGLEHPDDRPKSRKEGESTMYATPGQRVHMDENGNVLIGSSGSGIVHINPPGGIT